MLKKLLKPKQKTKVKTTSNKPVSPIGNVEAFQKKLEEMREDLARTVQKKREEVIPEPEVGDEADVAVRSLARDLVFELSGNERHILEEVEAALRRIDKKTFGLCEANGEKITIARLKAMPYARYCIKCQARFENS